VELVHFYSNPLWASARWLRMLRDALSHPRPCPEPPPREPQRVDRRLGGAALEPIVAEYVAGAPSTALARTYGIGKGTLLRLMQGGRHNIRRRGPRTG
jgi:hypothetical protein